MTTQAHPCRRPGPKVAPMGALSLAILRLEVRRLLRNRRTMISTLIMPVIFFLIFGMNSADAGLSAGHGNVSAFIMISLALYGAVLATASGSAMVSVERAAGWSRQLRLTLLSPIAYIATKMLTSLVLGFRTKKIHTLGLRCGHGLSRGWHQCRRRSSPGSGPPVASARRSVRDDP